MASLFDDLVAKKKSAVAPAPAASAPAAAPATAPPVAPPSLLQTLGRSVLGLGGDRTLPNQDATPLTPSNALPELGKAAGQIGQTADDYVRAATNRFGVGDLVAAHMSKLTGVGGGDLAAQQAATTAARTRLGPGGTALANITGSGPLAAGASAAGLGAGPLSLAVQGGGAGAIDAAQRGDSPVAGAGWGAGLGLGAGVLGRAITPLARWLGALDGKTPAAATTAARAAQQEAEAGLGKISYPESELGFSSGTNNLSVAELLAMRAANRNAPEVAATLNAGLPETEKKSAQMIPAVEERINRALAQGTPTGGVPGQGQVAVNALETAAQRAQAAEQLQRLSDLPAAKIRDAASELSQAAPLGSPQATAYGDIAKAPTGEGVPWWYHPAVTMPLGSAGTAIGGAIAPVVGHVAGALAGGAAGVLGAKMFGAGGDAAVQAAIARNYPALTGQSIGGQEAERRVGDLLRQLTLSQAGRRPF